MRLGFRKRVTYHLAHRFHAYGQALLQICKYLTFFGRLNFDLQPVVKLKKQSTSQLGYSTACQNSMVVACGGMGEVSRSYSCLDDRTSVPSPWSTINIFLTMYSGDFHVCVIPITCFQIHPVKPRCRRNLDRPSH